MSDNIFFRDETEKKLAAMYLMMCKCCCFRSVFKFVDTSIPFRLIATPRHDKLESCAHQTFSGGWSQPEPGYVILCQRWNGIFFVRPSGWLAFTKFLCHWLEMGWFTAGCCECRTSNEIMWKSGFTWHILPFSKCASLSKNQKWRKKPDSPWQIWILPMLDNKRYYHARIFTVNLGFFVWRAVLSRANLARHWSTSII